MQSLKTESMPSWTTKLNFDTWSRGLLLSVRWHKHDSDRRYIAAFHIVLTFISHMTQAMAEALARCQDFAAWDEEQARQWWLDNRNALPMEKGDETHTPLSDTHLLMDMDERLG